MYKELKMKRIYVDEIKKLKEGDVIHYVNRYSHGGVFLDVIFRITDIHDRIEGVVLHQIYYDDDDKKWGKGDSIAFIPNITKEEEVYYMGTIEEFPEFMV
jgi:molybdopterin converting factor small subunit